MPIGAAAAMLIGSAVSGGTSVASAAIQSHSAKKAREQQQQATNQALGVQQQANAPYLALGQQAAQRLAAMPQQPYTQVFGGGRGAQMPSSIGNPAGDFVQPRPQGPPLGSLASLGQPGMGPPPQAAGFQQALQRAPALPPGMVRLPDGRIVPASMAGGGPRIA